MLRRSRSAFVRRWAPRSIALAFGVSGTVHLVRPSLFTPVVPPSLPRPRELVYVSGVAELVCAAMLLGRTRRAGPASAALLLAVWPGNIQLAIDMTERRRPGDGWKLALAWARVPFQLPLIWMALQSEPHVAPAPALPPDQAADPAG